MDKSFRSKQSIGLVLGTLFLLFARQTSAQFTVLDDFESYADTAALEAAWTDRAGAPLQTLDTSFAFNGQNTMRIDYDASSSPTSVERVFAVDQNLALRTTFRILFTQGGGNSIEDIVLELRDAGDGLLGSAAYPGGTAELFQIWEINLTSGFTNLGQVRKIVLSIVDGGDMSGTGSVFFDDLSVSSGTYSTCRPCHGEFKDPTVPYVALTDGEIWLPDLHDKHRYTMLSADVAPTDECAVCHTNPERFPVFLDSSTGGSNLPAISCMGCHGRDEDMGNDGGVSPGRGAGLRQHHQRAGVTACARCHPDANPDNFKPVGEDVPPPYYFVPDVVHPAKPVDACSTSELFVSLVDGLDNDGDLLYELTDPDCRVSAQTAPVVGPFGLVAVIGLLLVVGAHRLGRDAVRG